MQNSRDGLRQVGASQFWHPYSSSYARNFMKLFQMKVVVCFEIKCQFVVVRSFNSEGFVAIPALPRCMLGFQTSHRAGIWNNQKSLNPIPPDNPLPRFHTRESVFNTFLPNCAHLQGIKKIENICRGNIKTFVREWIAAGLCCSYKWFISQNHKLKVQYNQNYTCKLRTFQKV